MTRWNPNAYNHLDIHGEKMQSPVILSALRTAIGKFNGILAPLSAIELGSVVVREVVSQAGLEGSHVDEVIMGNVISAGLGQNPARQVALKGGLGNHAGAMTINKVCGSGLKAVALAAQAVAIGDSGTVVAGGMESMTNCPFLLPQLRRGKRLGHTKMLDSVVQDGLWDVYEDCHMGMTAELVAEKYGISREAQDTYALESHRRAVNTTKKLGFKNEIVALSVPCRQSEPVIFKHDEGPREDTSLEKLGKLRPAFKANGTVTAGNAPGTNDGAAALVVTSSKQAKMWGKKPLARIVGHATSGTEPRWVMMAPVTAVKKLLKKIGWKLEELDLIELNEAFAVQAIAVIKELGLNPAKTNINGGAVALGHPIGASGARILVTLLHALEQRNLYRGIAVLCLGGGNAVALAIERE